jgi:hypothetical protein
MAGGLMNIVAYGSQDIYLTGTPQITFFKVVYRRHTNFSFESVELNFDGDVNFDNYSDRILPKIGDLIGNMYLKVELPEMYFERTVSNQSILDANNIYNNALSNLKKITTFMGVNINSYRAAYDVFSATNIINSTEMKQNILDVFATYATDSYVQSTITYYETNTPIVYITPDKFNIKTIANAIPFPDYYSKITFKKVLDDALSYSQKLVQYYEEQLKIAIDNRSDTISRNFKLAWVDRLGHSMLEYIEIKIGGQTIDKHYGEWMQIWYELSGKKDLNETYLKMIGDVHELTSFDRVTKPAYTLHVPLQFWFNKFNGLALPLIALQYDDVKIGVKFRKFREVAYVEDMRNYDDVNYQESVNLDNMFADNNFFINASLLVDYVYLDSLERRRFAQSSHEYLIEQTQICDIRNISSKNITLQLDFVNPCKNLVWTIQKKSYTKNDNGFTKCRWNNFSTTKLNKGISVDNMTLDLQGYRRIDDANGKYFNYVQPYYHHSNTPSDGINCYNFCLKPEEHQPTGGCNFSRIPKSIINISINPNMFTYYDADMNDILVQEDDDIAKTTDVTLIFYTINYNVLRILGGYGATAFV